MDIQGYIAGEIKNRSENKMRQIDMGIVSIILLYITLGILLILGGYYIKVQPFVNLGIVELIGLPIAFIVSKGLNPKESWRDAFIKNKTVGKK